MKMFKEVILKGQNHGRRFSIDIRWQMDKRPKPVILFLHGFKGFKDWGTFPLIAEKLSDAGYIVVKMNFSHNGVTPDDPVNFKDLEAFSENRFSFELEDVNDTVNFITGPHFPVPETDRDNGTLHLIGHSRGGATAIIYAADDPRIKSVCGWAAVCNLEDRWPPEILKEWEKAGVTYIPNSRTGQNMPMKYAIVEDYLENQQQMNVEERLRNMDKPVLLVHGTNDETVPLVDTEKVASHLERVTLCKLEGADHVFGGGHPYDKAVLPEHSARLIEETVKFLRNM